MRVTVYLYQSVHHARVSLANGEIWETSADTAPRARRYMRAILRTRGML